MNNTSNPFDSITREENEQIMKPIEDLMMEEFKNNVPFQATNIKLTSKRLSLYKKKYGNKKLSILAFSTALVGTGKARAYERLETFRKILERKLKKTKKFKNKSARF